MNQNLDGRLGAPKQQFGISPSSGVASGGQQGRMGLMHNGVGGASRGGGFQPGASPRQIGPTPFNVPGTPPHIAAMLKILSKR